MYTSIRVDKSWNFYSTTSSDFEWGQEPTLSVAGVSVPLGKVVNGQVKAQLAKVAPMIDAQMAEIVAFGGCKHRSATLHNLGFGGLSTGDAERESGVVP